MDSFLSIALTLFFVIDALGNIPTYLTLLESIQRKQRRWVVTRELAASLVFFFLFFLLGRWLTVLLQIDPNTVTISGGVVLFIVALRLIFVSQDVDSPRWYPSVPFLVPIAVPLIASPSFFAVLMIFAENNSSDLMVIGAMLCAWLVSALIYIFAQPILKLFKPTGLLAVQRFMGLLLTVIAIQKILYGLESILHRAG